MYSPKIAKNSNSVYSMLCLPDWNFLCSQEFAARTLDFRSMVEELANYSAARGYFTRATVGSSCRATPREPARRTVHLMGGFPSACRIKVSAGQH